MFIAYLVVVWYDLQIQAGNIIIQEENLSSQAPGVELLVRLVAGGQGGLGCKGESRPL